MTNLRIENLRMYHYPLDIGEILVIL